METTAKNIEAKAGHTPGPWEAVRLDFGHRQFWKAICSEGRIPETEANARLIAAAPELLELLAEIHHAEVFFQSACIARDFIDADKWENARKDALAKIPAVIAKAKGA